MFIFLDLETTSLNLEAAQVIECAWAVETTRINSKLFIPTETNRQGEKFFYVPIEVSAVTGIWDQDVQDCEPFNKSETYQKLRKYAESGYIAVAHNTSYDLPILEKYGVKFVNSICTLKLAKYLYPELPTHKLGALCAYLGLDRNYPGGAHRAGYDVHLLIQLFIALSENRNVTELMGQADKFLKENRFKAWPFGKFKDQEMNPRDPDQINYARWYATRPEDPKYPRDPEFVQHLKELFF